MNLKLGPNGPGYRAIFMPNHTNRMSERLSMCESDRCYARGVVSPLFDGEGLVTRRVRVARDQVAWVRYVLEGHDGLGFLHSEGGGELTLVAPVSCAAALDEVIDDLSREIQLTRR